MKKTSTCLLLFILAAVSLRADILFQDSTNYPYTNGCIEGQGLWYCDYPASPYRDALVTNNVLLLNTTNHDSVATPTNGWVNPTYYTYASFTINVSQLPSTANGGYFCQLQDLNDTNDCCHLFIDTHDTVVPGTYRLGIASYSTSFAALVPPHNYPMDLATGITYTVVMLFDNSGDDTGNDPLAGANLWINPSAQDYTNAIDSDIVSAGVGVGYAYGTDGTGNQNLQNIQIAQIGFSPYANAGISNVITATTFAEVNTTNLPVIGVQPQPATNYSGNSLTLYTAASGVDLTYQWYSQSAGLLTDDGVNIIGSTSNVLVINNLTATDGYYVVATDAYGNTATSQTAASTVITTPTPPFFTDAPINLTNNLFTTTGFTNIAHGTGPLSYQWYFAPSSAPTAFAPLDGQTGPVLSLDLVDYTYGGYYYVTAANSIGGGSTAFGPTNSLTELAPLVASIAQLHNLMISQTSQISANKTGTVTISSNNVTVGGYVTTFGGFGSSTYTEYFLQDAAGYGIEVYLYGFGNSNTPPVGTYLTVSAPVVVYRTGLEIEPVSPTAIVTNIAPVVPLAPKLSNASFNDFANNGLGTNALLTGCSLVTFTNVYLYGTTNGGNLGTGGTHSGVGGIFYSNGYNILYFTIGKYSVPNNTNTIEVFQSAYNYGTNVNPFADQPIPTHCYQLTGVYIDYEGTPELEPSRLSDYVVNPPPVFTNNLTVGKKGVLTMNWPVQPGSTYSVYSASNLLGSWTPAAYGLGYYPTNGAFTVTNTGTAKFYRVGTP